MKKNQSGFTLVEIAIVLVIIGLLLGGVLKGQELINSAKAKAVINDFRNVSVMINAYQDRFRAFPGDDAKITSNFSGGTAATTPTGKQGNGMIDGAWNSTMTTDESFLAWQHLRLANLATGSKTVTDADYQQKNADGGVIGFQTGTPAGAVAADVQGRIFVCQSQISGRIAQQIDSTMDNDRDIAKGSVFVLTSGATPATATAPLVESDFYVVCTGF